MYVWMMGRKMELPGQGRLVPWTVRTSPRARLALEARAKAKGVSVGTMLDRLCKAASLFPDDLP